jgi:tartrate dehydrogenase/decarboxylase/D-malate dehydrogenase
MMLEHLGEMEAALSIKNGVAETLASGNVRTADMGGSHKTYEMGDAIKKAILK